MILNIFSKRESRKPGADTDVYQYKEIPDHVRRQIILLWQRIIGEARDDGYGERPEFYASVCRHLREEYGTFHLLDLIESRSVAGLRDSHRGPCFSELANFFLFEKNISRCLDVIELCAAGLIGYAGNQEPIEILNTRLREGSVGFQIENGFAIRVDHQYIHAEIVKPALYFLGGKGFEGANDEFLQAHRRYRQGDYKGSLIEGAKALESVLKIVLLKRGQQISDRDTAANLLQKFFALHLLPSYLQDQVTALRDVLQGGVPKVRNKEAAHGQGEDVREVPEYLAAYGLHQTASAILLIVKAHEAAR